MGSKTKPKSSETFNKDFFHTEEFDPKLQNYKYLQSDRLVPGTIYLGHIPDGFCEDEMLSYFSQFGEVTRLKLARSKKTGKSKGFAYIEFACEEVAAIVASTMNNYLMFEKLLKCSVIPKDEVKDRMFTGYRLGHPLSYEKYRKSYNKNMNDKSYNKLMSQRASKLAKAQRLLKSVGIEQGLTFVKPQVSISTSITNSSILSSKNVSISSTHTLEFDSSEDEITFRTPPNSRKVHKVKTETKGQNFKSPGGSNEKGSSRKRNIEENTPESKYQTPKRKPIIPSTQSPKSILKVSTPIVRTPFGFTVTPLSKATSPNTSKKSEKKIAHEVNGKMNGFECTPLKKKNLQKNTGVRSANNSFTISVPKLSGLKKNKRKSAKF